MIRMSHKRDPNSNPERFRILNTNELRDLLQDEETMDQIIRLSQKFQDLQVDREALLTSNRILAEENLSQRPRLQNCKLQLAEKYQELEKLTTACQDKQRQLEAWVQKRSPHTAQCLIQEEVAHAEEESEGLLEKFMSGSVSLEGFLESFQSSRKVYHIRRAQAEKIQEFSRPQWKLRNLHKTEAKTAKQQEPPTPDSCTGQGQPRIFQLRYGLTPAIILPHFPLPSTKASANAACLPPLDSHLGKAPASGPSAPPPGPGSGQPVGLRVIGQIPGWPARPVRLQQLCRQSSHHHPDPPYR